ncbi:MAG TPA: hypothetical protein VIJ04_09830 [Xanthobacteraceae bacterium]|jgi:uncharacterized membrane protein YhaH (DUF805 family)
MGGLSILHLLIVVVILILYLLPIVKILQKAGYSGWWCLIVFVPLVNVVMFYVFAFANCPILRDKSAA